MNIQKKIFYIILYFNLLITNTFFINNFSKKININKKNILLYKHCSYLSRDVYDKSINFSRSYYNKSLYICFKGTSNLNDWKTNLNLKLVKYQKNNIDFYVHNGYYNQYNNIKYKLYNYLIYNKVNYDNIIICGHSLGGALANICAFDIVDKPFIHNKNVICVTFGSPRIGDKNFVNLYNSFNISTHRIVISGDPVPKLPLNGYYLHVCSSIFFKDDKIYIKPNKAYIAIKRLFIYLCKIDYTFKSHNIVKYIELFSNL